MMAAYLERRSCIKARALESRRSSRTRTTFRICRRPA